jgi:hypothetical protein
VEESHRMIDGAELFTEGEKDRYIIQLLLQISKLKRKVSELEELLEKKNT